MEIQDLSNNQGILPMKLGTARTIRTYYNLLHIVRLKNYEQNIHEITDALTSFDNTDELKDSIGITKIKLDELNNKLETLMPKFRQKRGLIDGLGTVIKSITGNMDADDAKRLNTERENLMSNQSHLKNEINKQTQINNRMIERFDNVTNHINNQQKIIENYLKQTQEQITNKIRSENHLLKQMQYLNQINYNIDLLNDHLTNIAEAVMMARLNIISKLILSPNELTEIYYIFENQSIHIKSDEHIYELLGLQAYYNDSNIIFNIQIPAIPSETYSLFHIIPLPVEKTKKIMTKLYAILNTQNIQYLDEKCPKTEDTFYCKESADREKKSNSICIAKLINNKPAECRLIESEDISEIIQPEPNYILLINIPETTI